MILNEKETNIIYNILWAMKNRILEPQSITDTDNTEDDYKALAERIDDETDLGWASEVVLTIESR